MRLGASGKVLQRADRLWSVRDLCRRSGKSRRQVYRDLRSGRIRPLGLSLGEWLLEPSALARLKLPPPPSHALLPEFEAASLDMKLARRKFPDAEDFLFQASRALAYFAEADSAPERVTSQQSVSPFPRRLIRGREHARKPAS